MDCYNQWKPVNSVTVVWRITIRSATCYIRLNKKNVYMSGTDFGAMCATMIRPRDVSVVSHIRHR